MRRGLIGWGWAGLLIATLAALLWMLSGPGALKPNGEPVAPDFAIFYLAGQLALQDGATAASDWTRLTAAYQQFFSVTIGGVAWNYPPPTLLPFMALAQLPYLLAVLLWSAGGLLALLGLWQPLWRTAPVPAAAAPTPASTAVLLALLLFPATGFNLLAGQNGLWLAALLGGALLRCDPWEVPSPPPRPAAWPIGVLCGLVALKPSLLPLLPLALAAGRFGRALAVLGATLVGLVLASVLCLSGASWRAFPAALQGLGQLEAAGAFPDYRMPTLFLGLRRLAVPAEAALLAQGALALLAALAVGWIWHAAARDTGAHTIPSLSPPRRVPAGARSAVTAAAVPLVPPYLFDYDLVILFLPLYWLWRQPATGGTAARLLLLLCGILLGLPPLVTRTLGFAPALFLMPLLLLWCCWSAISQEPRSS